MLRQSASRLLTPALRSYRSRPLSTTTPSLIKIRSSNPKPPQPPSSNNQPSPAERPPTVPEDISTSKPFEPITSSPAGATPPKNTAAGPTPTQVEAGADGVPLTPPLPEGHPPPKATEASTATPTPEAEAEPATGVPLEPPTPEAAAEELPTDYSKIKLPSLDIDPEAQASIAEPESETEQREKRTGAGKREDKTSAEKTRRVWIRYGYAALAVGGIAAVLTKSSDEGATGSTPENQEGIVTKFTNNISEIFDYFNKPAFKTLLPDPLPPPHQRPYTLVIDLEGLLVHSSWDRASGWKTAKRPGVDYFLGYLSQFYEIVLFSSAPLYTAAPVAEKLDPYQAYLPYRLFREATRYVNGKVVKDLSYLNRDLSKVILLDTNSEHAELQPENSIIIKPWNGQPRDKGLVEMIPFLESIGIFNPADVRPILKAYEGKNIPVEYAKKEAEAKQKAIEEWERMHPSAISGAGSGWLSSMFGSVAAPGQTRPNQPMTYLEQKRAQAQKIYQEEQKYWAEHADEFKKLIEEDKQRQIAEMKGSLLGMLTGPKPQESEQKK
ncbi:mitochondrial import inner membrane translocase subunit TIM50 [Kwoniella mangroviensis CBS 8886]|nr:mitochondrial import inner membrane translocase subunit TIM50 [Kwoniella mangroviensis CBS 8886]